MTDPALTSEKSEPRIEQMSQKLGFDLEIIGDGEYVKLRRFSSYYIPTFCFYSYRGKDLLTSSQKVPSWQHVIHEFNENIFSGFVNEQSSILAPSDCAYAMLVLQSEPFRVKMNGALILNDVQNYRIRHVDYETFAQEEFFIEPTDERMELFCKFPKYAYQHEARLCLLNNRQPSVSSRFDLNIGPWNEGGCSLLREQVYMEVKTRLKRL